MQSKAYMLVFDGLADWEPDAITPEEAAIFIMPGGEMWVQGPHEEVIKLLHKFHAKGVAIAAICGATLEVARAGLMHGLRHTSNSKGYLKAMIPDYVEYLHRRGNPGVI